MNAMLHLSHIAQWVGVTLMVIGTAFTVISAYGLVIFNDQFYRQHAAAKPQMAGYLCCSVGLALIMQSWVWTGVVFLAILLQILTVPVGAHLMASASMRLWRDEKGEEQEPLIH